MFLISGKSEARCSYKIVLIKKKRVVLYRLLVHEHKHLKANSGNFLVTEKKLISHLSEKDVEYELFSRKYIA